MKAAIRMFVATVVIALVGTWAGPGLSGPTSARALDEFAIGLDIVAVCRVGDLVPGENGRVSGMYSATIKNISDTAQGYVLKYGVRQTQKTGLMFVKKVIIKPGKSITVTVGSGTIFPDREWELGFWMFPNVVEDSEETGITKEILPAPEDDFECGQG